MKPVYFILLFLLLLIGFFGWSALNFQKGSTWFIPVQENIQADLTDRVEDSLRKHKSQRFSNVSVDRVEHLHVFLKGNALDDGSGPEATRELLEEVAFNHRGVGAVDLEGVVIGTPPPVRTKPVDLAVIATDQKVILKGNVPTEDFKNALVAEAKKKFPAPAKVVDLMVVDPQTLDPQWGSKLPAYFGNFVDGTKTPEFVYNKGKLALKGISPDEATRARMGKEASDLFGPKVAVTNLLQIAKKDPINLKIARDGATIKLTGIVPNEADKLTAAKAAAMANPDAKIVNQLKVSDSIAPAPWLSKMAPMLPGLLKTSNNGSVSIANNKVTLRGLMVDDATRNNVAASAGRILGPNVKVENLLEVKTPVFAATPKVYAIDEGDTIRLTGLVPNENIKKALGDAAAKSHPKAKIINKIDIDEKIASTPVVAALPNMLSGFLKGTENGSVDYAGNKVVLNGTVPNQAVKTGFGNEAAKMFGQNTKIDNLLKIKAPEVAAIPGKLMARRKGTDIVLNGIVPSDKVKKSIGDTAALSYPNAKVTNNLQVNPKVPATDWITDVNGILPGFLKDTEDGSLSITDKEVTLVGTVANAPIKSRYGKAVADIMGNGVKVNNLLQIAAPKAAPAKVLDDSNMEQAKKLLTDLKLFPVYFDTNSDVVKASEKEKVQKAANLLKSDKGNFLITVGGHADHRGNAAYNKQLSIRRAGSVRKALINLGVNADRLDVDSYGEKGSTYKPNELWKSRRVEFHVRSLDKNN